MKRLFLSSVLLLGLTSQVQAQTVAVAISNGYNYVNQTASYFEYVSMRIDAPAGKSFGNTSQNWAANVKLQINYDHYNDASGPKTYSSTQEVPVILTPFTVPGNDETKHRYYQATYDLGYSFFYGTPRSTSKRNYSIYVSQINVTGEFTTTPLTWTMTSNYTAITTPAWEFAFLPWK